jgi:hypothetical protein
VQHDDGLFLRVLALFAVAKAASTAEPFFLLEQPQRPQTYLSDQGLAQDVPSFWTTPAWLRFQGRHALRLFDLCQDEYGHTKKKPFCPVGIPACKASREEMATYAREQAQRESAGRGVPSAAWAAWAPGLRRLTQWMLRGCLEAQQELLLVRTPTGRPVGAASGQLVPCPGGIQEGGSFYARARGAGTFTLA